MRNFFISFSFFILVGSLVIPSARAAGKPFDHSLWNQFIQTHVNSAGQVNYQAVNQDPSLLEDYFKKVNAINPLEMGSDAWPREERLALWLNVYNAGMIETLRKKYPVQNIQQIPGIWDDAFIPVAGKLYSLNWIRADALIKSFRDEKIHTALACGAKSCPPIFEEAFTGPRVEGQLYLAARKFVNDIKFVDVSPGEKKVRLSRILKWYGEDFKLDFGTFQNERRFTPIENAVLSFVAHYIAESDQLIYLEEKNYKIKYMTFDWSPNEWVSDAV